MNFFLKVDEFANASAHIYLFAGIRSTTGFASVRAGAGGKGIRNDGNACRIISPILKTFKAVQKDFFCLVISYVADYSTHNILVHAEKRPSALSGLRVHILTYVKEYAPVQTLVLPRICAIFEREHYKIYYPLINL